MLLFGSNIPFTSEFKYKQLTTVNIGIQSAELLVYYLCWVYIYQAVKFDDFICLSSAINGVDVKHTSFIWHRKLM